MIVIKVHRFSILYAHIINQLTPESVVSPGIALAISAMAFPSSCIRDTTADGDVGTDVGADVEEDIDHYLIV